MCIRDRFVSAWQNKVLGSNLFEFDDETHEHMRNITNFIGWFADQDPATCDRHLRLQTRLIPENGLDLLGRMETFEDDLDQFLDMVGITRETKHHRNQSKKAKSELAIGDRKRLADIYAPDLERFGYAP